MKKTKSKTKKKVRAKLTFFKAMALADKGHTVRSSMGDDYKKHRGKLCVYRQSSGTWDVTLLFGVEIKNKWEFVK